MLESTPHQSPDIPQAKAPNEEKARKRTSHQSRVTVIDFFRSSGTSFRGSYTPKKYELADPKAFEQFLEKPCEKPTLTRFIHARNAPWVLELVQKHHGRDYSALAEWMATPAITSNPRERVWYSTSETNYNDLKFGYEHFVAHQANGHGWHSPTHLSNLKFQDHETGQITQWRVCLQRIGVVCFSFNDKYQGHNPAAVAVIDEETYGCPSEWTDPLDVITPGEDNIGVEKFSHQFFENVLYWVLRGTSNHWVTLIRCYQSQFILLEKDIFEDAENEHWGDTLWRYTQNWNTFSRLLTLHVRMMSYLHKHAERFLKGYYESLERNLYGETSKLEPYTNFYPAGRRLFGSLNVSFESSRTELTQALITPTTNLLDMIYKRVAIRDARNSLILNESLWRLSWITFIFLPLTFLSGFFGMNVNVFADNPSIKWWFIVAVPLMVIVFMGWFFFRRTYAVVSRKSPKHGKADSAVV